MAATRTRLNYWQCFWVTAAHHKDQLLVSSLGSGPIVSQCNARVDCSIKRHSGPRHGPKWATSCLFGYVPFLAGREPQGCTVSIDSRRMWEIPQNGLGNLFPSDWDRIRMAANDAKGQRQRFSYDINSDATVGPSRHLQISQLQVTRPLYTFSSRLSVLTICCHSDWQRGYAAARFAVPPSC
jgi:hypothetical protein